MGALQGTDDRAADSQSQTRLFEFGLSGALAGFPGFDDLDVFGQDVDVAFGRLDVTADLPELVACGDIDAAVDAPDCGCGGCGGLILLVSRLVAFADGEGQA